MRSSTLLLAIAVTAACGPASDQSEEETAADAGPNDSKADAGETLVLEEGAIGKATARVFDEDTGTTAFLNLVAGDYPVAVYAAPTDEEVGPAMLTLAFDGTQVTLSLKLGSGAQVTSVTVDVDDDTCRDGRCVRWIEPTSKRPLAPAGGKDVFLDNYYAGTPEEAPVKRAIRAAFLPDGYVRGEVGLTGQYQFRNDILAYGASVPAVFDTLAGAYTAVDEAVFCGDNPLQFDVNGDGSIRIRGQANVSCEAKDVTVKWNGNDDLIVPVGDGAQMILDGARIGGSGGGGVVYVDLPTASAASTFTRLRTEFSGTEGHIETRAGTVVKVNP